MTAMSSTGSPRTHADAIKKISAECEPAQMVRALQAVDERRTVAPGSER